MTADPIPLIDLRAQYARFKPQIDVRLQNVLDSARFVMGPEVTELEAELADRADVPHGIGVASGTDALILPMVAAGIGPGDAVFVPAFTYVATAGAVAMTGATPVFCDVDPETFHLDVADLERRLARLPDDLTPRAVIPVDLFGLPFDPEPLRAIAEERNLLVIADAAQSYGASLGGRPVGSLAPVTAVSFYPTKPLGCFGDGGAILTTDDDLAASIRSIRVHGTGAGGVFERVGTNSRLDTMQAAVLLTKLEALCEDLARRAAICARYDAAFSGHFGVQRQPDGAFNTRAVYSILCDERDAVHATLREENIGTRIYYDVPLHRTPAMERFADPDSPLPVCDELSQRILGIPIYPEMTDAQVERVCDVVLDALAAARG